MKSRTAMILSSALALSSWAPPDYITGGAEAKTGSPGAKKRRKQRKSQKLARRKNR